MIDKRLNDILLGIFVALVLAAGLIYFWKGNTQFNLDNASFDTSSFIGYERGVVTKVVNESQDRLQYNQTLYQQLEVKLLSGPRDGEVIITEFTRILDSSGGVKLTVGDKVVLGQLSPSQEDQLLFEENSDGEYVIVDRQRINGLIFVVVFFVALAGLIGRRKGWLSLLGLVVAGAILLVFTAPMLLSGQNAMLVTVITGGLIAITTMLIAHGYNLRTQLSIISTLVALVFAMVLSYVFVWVAQLFGLGQSDAFVLQNGLLGSINLRGLLLGGLVISLLGVLDDVTTTQTASVEEVAKANPALGWKELFSAGMSVGREHIASLINTLILVYVGASLPLFLLLVIASNQPLWVMLNSEFMAEEIVRALAGSSGLILAVPISTFLASKIFSKKLTK